MTNNTRKGTDGRQLGLERMTMNAFPQGWTRVDGDPAGVPLWKRDGEPVYVATRDRDQLLMIGAALVRFDRMSPREFEEFVSEAPP